MKLDRNLNASGIGKYALIEIRKLTEFQKSEVIRSVKIEQLEGGAMLAGVPGEAITLVSSGQFFVIKLKDRFAARALHAYADAIYDDCAKGIVPTEQRKEMEEYADEVRGEALCAERTPCKLPS